MENDIQRAMYAQAMLRPPVAEPFIKLDGAFLCIKPENEGLETLCHG